MALITSASTAGIMCPGAAYEGCGGMAEVTIHRGVDVVDVLTRRCCIIVAGFTIINDAGMVESSTDKAAGSMTNATVLIGSDMATVFSCSECAIMAGATVADDSCVIKGSRYKAGSLMAITTVTSGWDMVWRRYFSSGYSAIMA
jgi:NDP-sugar pyrophosphorylase family protein